MLTRAVISQISHREHTELLANQGDMSYAFSCTLRNRKPAEAVIMWSSSAVTKQVNKEEAKDVK